MWRKTLREFNAPYFHATEFFNPAARLSHENPYRGWAPAKDVAFVEALLTVVDDHRVWPVGCSINIADFMSLSYGERCYLSGGEIDEIRGRWIHHGAPNIPYHVGVAGLVADAHTLRKPEVTRLQFILESQSALSPFAKQTWERWKRLERKEKGSSALLQLGSMGFAGSSEERSLEAADLIAYELGNTLTRAPRINERHRRIMRRLLRKRDALQIVDAAYLEDLLSRLTSHEDREWLRSTEEPRHG